MWNRKWFHRNWETGGRGGVWKGREAAPSLRPVSNDIALIRDWIQSKRRQCAGFRRQIRIEWPRIECGLELRGWRGRTVLPSRGSVGHEHWKTNLEKPGINSAVDPVPSLWLWVAGSPWIGSWINIPAKRQEAIPLRGSGLISRNSSGPPDQVAGKQKKDKEDLSKICQNVKLNELTPEKRIKMKPFRRNRPLIR